MDTTGRIYKSITVTILHFTRIGRSYHNPDISRPLFQTILGTTWNRKVETLQVQVIKSPEQGFYYPSPDYPVNGIQKKRNLYTEMD